MTWFIILSLAITFVLVIRRRIREFMFIRSMRKYNARRKAWVHGEREFTASYAGGEWRV